MIYFQSAVHETSPKGIRAWSVVLTPCTARTRGQPDCKLEAGLGIITAAAARSSVINGFLRPHTVFIYDGNMRFQTVACLIIMRTRRYYDLLHLVATQLSSYKLVLSVVAKEGLKTSINK